MTTPCVADIKPAVCEHYHVPALDMVSQRQGTARARQIAMYLARELTPLSLPAIGRHFGNRDHSTVSHACKLVAHLVDTDPATAAAVGQIRARLEHPGQQALPLGQG